MPVPMPSSSRPSTEVVDGERLLSKQGRRPEDRVAHKGPDPDMRGLLGHNSQNRPAVEPSPIEVAVVTRVVGAGVGRVVGDPQMIEPQLFHSVPALDEGRERRILWHFDAESHGFSPFSR
jgi:hypothetical protein